MMRPAGLALSLALMLLALPAIAAGWGHYDNARYGYATDVPPGFVAEGESDNGDGQVFSTPTARLTVFGANILAADFEAELRDRQAAATADGWAITYQVSTPNAGSFSGKKGGRILYVRAIALCRGTQLAVLQFDYSRADLAAFDPIVTRLVGAFRSMQGSAMCG
jgi:hypothetical protein